MSEESRKPTGNRILDALPDADYERIAEHLVPIHLSHGQVLYEVNQRIEHVYFPTGSMLSLVSQLSDGSNIEVGVVGFEGMTGLPLMLGVDKSPNECMAQIPNGAIRAGGRAIKDEFKRGGAFQDLLLRYTQSLMLMTSQVTACNRVHHVGERLARWLLMSQDRFLSEELPLTQEFISMMLGTRRAGVSEASGVLQDKGLIKYRRGHITIVDRPALEDFACECYGIIKAEFNQQLA